ncbi:arsenic metallochaperone ArsD family protein, partial [Acinetobacter baumannii]|uniref:arsenic metallochaperone ArsD family protein n=1 Tax=Acinetobacter baumannii TaxID=470 RepID=UPI00111213C5
AENDAVKQFLQLSGSAGLPLVLVNGVTALTGVYPDRAQLARWAGREATPATDTVPAGVQMLGRADAGGCCSTDSSNSSGCC